MDESRLRCALTQPFDHTKRRQADLQQDPFTPEITEQVEEALKQVQEAMEYRGMGSLPLNKYKWRNT